MKLNNYSFLYASDAIEMNKLNTALGKLVVKANTVDWLSLRNVSATNTVFNVPTIKDGLKQSFFVIFFF